MTNPQPFSNDPAAWAAMLENMRHAFAAASANSTGPVNWDLARQMSTAIAQQEDSELGLDEQNEVTEALHLADLWLEPATVLPSGLHRREAWTRLEWTKQTEQTWRRLCDPVAGRVVDAMSSLLETKPDGDLPDSVSGMFPPELRSQLGSLQQMFAGIGGVVFGAQVGQGIGALSSGVLSATDIGLPLGPAGVGALLARNVEEHAAGLERPEDEVRLYVALREAAHHRLYEHVPWLRAHVLNTVEAYARGIVVDHNAFEDALEKMQIEVDPSDPESMQVALSDGLFTPAQTPEQQQALARLELALALVEGWVTHVVDTVAAERLPSAAALSEAFRRRRAGGGPAEQTFATLVGLELRPRKLREAAALWELLTEKREIEGRDAVWQHPDLLPSGDDLDDPETFADRDTNVEIPGLDDL